MLVMKITTNDEYYYVEKENNQYSVLCINNEKDYYLDKTEWNNLITEMLGGEKKFLERKDGYDIYLDSMNNKRYFKDGVEDLEKLLKVNSTSALLFQDEFLEDDNSSPKKLSLSSKKSNKFTILFLTFIVTVELMNSPFAVVRLNGNENPQRNIENIENIVEPITLEEMTEKINECKTYEQYQKDILANKDFLRDVFLTADTKTRKELRIRYNNLAKKIFTEQEKEDRPKTSGYVSQMEPGVMHLRDDTKEIFHSSGSHEFIHINQVDLTYSYIIEPSAEMMSEEYFNDPAQSYYESRVNLAILMEIIGPEPIMRLNFNGERKEFENILKLYLSEEDVELLLSEYRKKADRTIYKGKELEVADHKLIRKILGKMYTKKYPGKIMEEDPTIQQYLNKNKKFMSNRYFFNQYSEKYYASKKMLLETKKLYNEKIADSIESISFSKTETLTKEEVREIIDNHKLDDNVEISINFKGEDGKGKYIKISNNNIDSKIININNKTIKEFLNDSSIQFINFEKTTTINQDLGKETTIPNIFKNNKDLNRIDIHYINKSYGIATLEGNGNIYIKKNKLCYIPSVAEKFPKQIRKLQEINKRVFNSATLEIAKLQNDKKMELNNIFLNTYLPLRLVDTAFYKINEREKTGIYSGEINGTEDTKWITILMEIIGPKPIKDYYYSKDSTIIENAINKYLDSNDVKELLNEFKKTPEEADYEKIKSIISKLYENKNFGHQMEEDPAIYCILLDYCSTTRYRYYFNSEKNEENQTQDVEITINIPYDNNFENNLTEITYDTLGEVISKENFINIIKTNNISNDEYFYIKYKDNNYYMGMTISKKTDQDRINNIKDIIQNNKYENINIIKYNKITINPTSGIIRDIILNENISNLDIQYKDGNKGKITLDIYGNICPNKTILLTIPSLSKKFPDQVENHYKR